jgi:hypothetical protein
LRDGIRDSGLSSGDDVIMGSLPETSSPYCLKMEGSVVMVYRSCMTNKAVGLLELAVGKREIY